MASTQIVAYPLIRENPYQQLLYEALEHHGFTVGEGDMHVRWLWRNRRTARVLHFHWPQSWYVHRSQPGGPLTVVKLALFALQLTVARLLGYRIAWTIHEVFPLNPAAPWADRAGSRMLARASHVLLANDHETAEQARKELGRAADGIEVVPHPSYSGAYPEGRSRTDVRAELGIPDSAFVFLLFGHVTAYKRLDTFVAAFQSAGLQDAALVIAGLNQHEPSAQAVRAAAAEDPRIKPLLEFIPDERVAELFGASDAAIAPRQDGGTSGALVLALSLGVPVVAAEVATYTRVTDGETAGYLYTPWDEASMVSALRAAAADPADARRRGEAGRAMVTGVTWEQLAARAAARLNAALGSRKPGREAAHSPAGESA
jgi:beta-1,4-mannosyltransferase